MGTRIANAHYKVLGPSAGAAERQVTTLMRYAVIGYDPAGFNSSSIVQVNDHSLN